MAQHSDTTEVERRRLAWLEPRYWIVAGALLAALVSGHGVLDSRAQAATDRVLGQALLTYGVARSLDAAVSLAEGTELALEPGGIGVTVSAGEILEPIDDLIEQFSSVMLVSTTSLGLQSLFLRASAWTPVTVLLLIFLLARVLLAFRPGSVPPTVRRIVSSGTSLLLIARFAVPLYSVATSFVFERFLQPGQAEAVQALEETSGDVRELDALDEEAAEPGLVGRVSRWFAGAMEQLDVSERVEALRTRVDGAVDHLVHLLVVFVLQTLVLPVLSLWMVARMVGATLGRRR